MKIEIETTYKIKFTEEQLRQLFIILDRSSNDLRGMELIPIYHEIKDIFNEINQSRTHQK